MGGRALYHHHGHAPGLLSAGQKAGEYRCWLSEQIDPWDPGPVSLSVHHSVPSHAQSLTDNKCLTFFFFLCGKRKDSQNRLSSWPVTCSWCSGGASPFLYMEENAVCAAPAAGGRKQAWTLPVEALSFPLSPQPLEVVRGVV